MSAGKWHLCKCYETWHGGSCRVHSHSDRFWAIPVNRFRCVATPDLSHCHRQGKWGLLLYSCSRYYGNAWYPPSSFRIMYSTLQTSYWTCIHISMIDHCSDFAVVLFDRCSSGMTRSESEFELMEPGYPRGTFLIRHNGRPMYCIIILQLSGKGCPWL